LEGSPEAWNVWRNASANRKIDLSGATVAMGGGELHGLDFSEVDFSRAVFEDIVIRGANFTNAVLHGTQFRGDNLVLEECDFQDAIFDDTTFSFCKLIKCKFHRTDTGFITGLRFFQAHCESVTFSYGKLNGVDFSRAELHHVDFSEVKFQDCNFVNATADYCIFKDAELTNVKFELARLIGSDFRGATFVYKPDPSKPNELKDLFSADLSDADFRGARGYQFDDNRAQGIILSPHASDEWSVLRRAYTGTKFGLNLLFLLLFFLPIVVKAVFWMQVAQFEHTVDQVEASLNKTAEVLSVIPHPALQILGERIRELASRGSCLGGSCKRVWLPLLLLGIPIPFEADYWPAYLLLILTAAAAPALVLYNIARGVLTYFVLPLRDEEDRCGHTPRRLWNDTRRPVEREALEPDTEPSKRFIAKTYQRITNFLRKLRTRYAWMVPLHTLVLYLQYVAYALAAIHIGRVLGVFVSLP
jgi:uncharacterized protein YjbI with pentapeptide repeats